MKRLLSNLAASLPSTGLVLVLGLPLLFVGCGGGPAGGNTGDDDSNSGDDDVADDDDSGDDDVAQLKATIIAELPLDFATARLDDELMTGCQKSAGSNVCEKEVDLGTYTLTAQAKNEYDIEYIFVPREVAATSAGEFANDWTTEDGQYCLPVAGEYIDDIGISVGWIEAKIYPDGKCHLDGYPRNPILSGNHFYDCRYAFDPLDCIEGNVSEDMISIEGWVLYDGEMIGDPGVYVLP